MSEWEAFVCCTCFQQGLTTEPPVPCEDLLVNAFGIVTHRSSLLPGDDPEMLCDWREGLTPDESRCGTACAHTEMRQITQTFYWPGSRSHTGHYPVAEALVAAGPFPQLQHLIYRPEGREHPSGGTWITAVEAESALDEVRLLFELMPPENGDGSRHFTAALLDLALASSTTGNPIVVHYNGLMDDAW